MDSFVFNRRMDNKTKGIDSVGLDMLEYVHKVVSIPKCTRM